MTWSITEVAGWLESIELGELSAQFMENSIGGSELLDLSQDDMKMLGVNKLGHRKKLIRKIGILRGDTTMTDSSSQQISTSSIANSAADSSEHSESSIGTPLLTLPHLFFPSSPYSSPSHPCFSRPSPTPLYSPQPLGTHFFNGSHFSKRHFPSHALPSSFLTFAPPYFSPSVLWATF